MSTISPEVVRQVVQEVVKEVVGRSQAAPTPAGDGIFADMDSAVTAADAAWRTYLECRPSPQPTRPGARTWNAR